MKGIKAAVVVAFILSCILGSALGQEEKKGTKAKDVEAVISGVGQRTITFQYLRKEDGALIASGWTKHACVDEKGEVTKIPAKLEATLKEAISPKE